MESIDPALLACVMGGDGDGPNRTTQTTPDGNSTSTARSNYAYCADKVQTACNDLNTGWFSGVNKQAAAACTLKALPDCPKPLPGQ